MLHSLIFVKLNWTLPQLASFITVCMLRIDAFNNRFAKQPLYQQPLYQQPRWARIFSRNQQPQCTRIFSIFQKKQNITWAKIRSTTKRGTAKENHASFRMNLPFNHGHFFAIRLGWWASALRHSALSSLTRIVSGCHIATVGPSVSHLKIGNT